MSLMGTCYHFPDSNRCTIPQPRGLVVTTCAMCLAWAQSLTASHGTTRLSTAAVVFTQTGPQGLTYDVHKEWGLNPPQVCGQQPCPGTSPRKKSP